jgi:outer membrane protein assembly factor BamD (BamD/ComL family)
MARVWVRDGDNVNYRVFILRGLASLMIGLLASTTAWGQAKPEAIRRKVAGNEYYKQRKFEDAQNQYLEALRLEPAFTDVHYNLGIIYYYHLRDYERSIYHLTMYKRLEPNASDMDQVKSHLALGLEKMEEIERGDYSKAVLGGTAKAFESFLQKHPEGYYANFAKAELKKITDYEDDRARQTAEIQGAFSHAMGLGTPEAMDSFLLKYPDSSQSQVARDMRRQWLERRGREKAYYDASLEEDSIEALEEFVTNYPDSEFTKGAKNRLSHLINAEETLTAAIESGSIPLMEKFLANYSDTPYAEEANEALGELRKADVEKATEAEALRLLDKSKE